MQQIKNIIFDLGGVFVDIHFHLTQEAFEKLGVTHFQEFFTQHHASDLFQLLETGKLSEKEFYAAFRKETGLNVTDEEIKHAWNALLDRFPKERINWLKKIKNRYKIFLFSNTNKIHYDAFMQGYTEDFGKNDFNEQFIKAYYSQELGLRKPFLESFQYILNEQGLDPAETLFIDDTLKNIEAAKKAGLQTFHLVSPMTVLDLDL